MCSRPRSRRTEAMSSNVIVSSRRTPREAPTIRHQMRGCHTWSFANGPYKASLKVKADRDTTLVVVNHDVMPHKLRQVAGPKAHVFKAGMNKSGAKATVTFTRAGVYRFVTKAGEDYPWMHEMKTVGEDNVLRLTITVT